MTFRTKAEVIGKVAPRVYRITERGTTFLAEHSESIFVADLRKLPGWEAWQTSEEEPAMGAGDRWFESSRPDHFFEGQNSGVPPGFHGNRIGAMPATRNGSEPLPSPSPRMPALRGRTSARVPRTPANLLFITSIRWLRGYSINPPVRFGESITPNCCAAQSFHTRFCVRPTPTY